LLARDTEDEHLVVGEMATENALTFLPVAKASPLTGGVGASEKLV
jgi:hypothetical protein